VTGSAIQWYPGHMARAMRRLAEDLRLIDVVLEVIDARVPRSGANPALERIAGRKPRLRILSREDLADPKATEVWLERFHAAGDIAVAVAAKERSGAARLRDALAELASAKRSARAIAVGIPNAGKSTVINALVGKNVAKTEDRAGVTRTAQWFRVTPNLELMDTAGILVPKIETQEAQWKLALVGAVPRSRFDAEDVVARFHRWAATSPSYAASVPELETFAQSRGFVRHGNVIDAHNAAWAYIKDFSDGKFGRITLE
jgi:ribosome biogenesis GTPase A